ASGYEPEGREFESLRAHHPLLISFFLMPSNKALAWMQRFAALAIVAFWVSFWIDHSDLPPLIVDLEWSFLVPDLAWIVVAFLISSHWLLAGDRRGMVATAAAGASLA